MRLTRKIILPFLISIFVIFNLGMAKDSKDVEPYPFSSYFVSFSEPMDTEIIGNPLDYAGKKIGLDVRNCVLPRAYEGAYRLACRFPIIDYISNNPLYMKQWSEDTCERIKSEHKENGLQSVDYALTLFNNGYDYVGINSETGEISIDDFKKQFDNSPFTDKYKDFLHSLFVNFHYAQFFNNQAFENLTAEDKEFFKANPAYFIAPDGKRMPSITGDVSSHFEFIRHARQVKMENIMRATKAMSEGIRHYLFVTKDMKPEDFYVDPKRINETWSFELPEGRVVIAGYGNDTHGETADFIIDLGGDDTYTNNPGSGMWRTSFLIDHSGNDKYDSPDGDYTQGFGFLGSGFLVDLGGNDIYKAHHYSQGAGIMGVGVLWDKSGDDVYDANAVVQGAAMFGLGMILDDNGDDRYSCATLGQGGATTLGLGILSDLGGDDRYHLNIDVGKDNLGSAGYGQGGALSFRHYPWNKKLTAYGGVGMLVDASGNDRYRTGGWCDQGGSYIMSLGVLYDGEGNDHYTAGTGQGSGIHVTNAILIDKNGNDIYDGGFRTGASGGDRSPGFLIDYHGNDIYNAGNACYGTACKPFAYSLMIDYEGNDIYNAQNPKDKITMNNWESFSGVWPESEPYLWPYAICLDLGGDDDYKVMRRKNNTEYSSFGHGIHIDMEWSGGDIIGEIANPLEQIRPFPVPDSVRTSFCYDDILKLMSQDTFERFQAVGNLVDKGVSTIPTIVESILASPYRQYNRDAMECIHYFLTQGKITDKEIPELARLLDARDPEVGTIIGDDFGVFRLEKASNALIEALNDNDSQVRRFALRSLLEFKNKEALPIARKMALGDPSEDVRRIAVRYIARITDGSDPYPILEEVLQVDPASSVKIAAIDNIAYLQDTRALDLLCDLSKSEDIYLMRAAGRALAEMYQVDGIGVLIESLTFPSIDAFYNYDRNVPNYISAYTGFEFPEEQRYEQDAWRKWFTENKDKIDIHLNVDSFRAFTTLTEDTANLPETEQIEKMEGFLKKFPEHGRAKKMLAEKLNGVAWNMVTAAPDQPGYNPKKGLEYARRAVELSDDPNYADTLGEALLANGMIDECEKLCRDMLEKHPGNQMFVDKLERCKKM